MQELIDQLTAKAGITAEQATKALETIKEFVKEKFPMLGGAVDNMFASQGGGSAATETAAPTGNIMDKISDVIPGETGEKVEAFVKNAAHKAEEVFEELKDKISGKMGDKQ